MAVQVMKRELKDFESTKKEQERHQKDKLGEHDKVRQEAVRERLKRGMSVAVYNVNHRHSIIARLSSQMAIHFGVPVNAHFWLSPPRAEPTSIMKTDQGLLILQIEGQKWWYIYESEERSVRTISGERIVVDNGRQLRRMVDMEVGDGLYIPPGTYFRTKSGSMQSSFHITLKMDRPRYATWEGVLARTLINQESPAKQAWDPSDRQACDKIPLALVDAAMRLASIMSPELQRTVLPLKNSQKCESLPDICGVFGNLERQEATEYQAANSPQVRAYYSWRRAAQELAKYPDGRSAVPQEVAAVLQGCCKASVSHHPNLDEHPVTKRVRIEMAENLKKWRSKMKGNVKRHMHASYEW